MRALIRRAGVYVWHTLVCLSALAFVLSLFWSISYILSIRQRRQAEQMLHQLAALPLGTTDFSTIQRIARNSGGREDCTVEPCRYDFDDRFMFADSWLPRVLRRTEWDYVGLRPWQLSVFIRKRTDGLADIDVIALVGRGRGWLENEGLLSGNEWALWEVFLNTSAKGFDDAFEREEKDILNYGIRTREQIKQSVGGLIVSQPQPGSKGAGEVLYLHLSPNALPDIRNVAFNLNLHCATAISPCRHLCQVAPAAWHEYVRFLQSNGLSVGQTPECGITESR